jgi:hypothetical protein
MPGCPSAVSIGVIHQDGNRVRVGPAALCDQASSGKPRSLARFLWLLQRMEQSAKGYLKYPFFRYPTNEAVQALAIEANRPTLCR